MWKTCRITQFNRPFYTKFWVFSKTHVQLKMLCAGNVRRTDFQIIFNLLLQEFVKHKKDYKRFMSTVFKLLKSNASIDEEVDRIADLENEFLDVSSPIKFLKFSYRYGVTWLRFITRLLHAEYVISNLFGIPAFLQLKIVSLQILFGDVLFQDTAHDMSCLLWKNVYFFCP